MLSPLLEASWQEKAVFLQRAASFASYQRRPSLKAGNQKKKEANNLTLFKGREGNNFPHCATLCNILQFSSTLVWRFQLPRYCFSRLKWPPSFSQTTFWFEMLFGTTQYCAIVSNTLQLKRGKKFDSVFREGNNTLPCYKLQPNGFCEKMLRGGGEDLGRLIHGLATVKRLGRGTFEHFTNL